MTRKKIFLILVVGVFIALISREAAFFYSALQNFVTNNQKHVNAAKNVVLVNIGNRGREDIALYLNEILTHRPHSIILNFKLLKFSLESKADSMLLHYIENDNVWIKVNHKGIGFHGVDRRFLSKSKHSFFEPITDSEYETNFYVSYYENDSGKIPDLSFAIAQTWTNNLKEDLLQEKLVRIPFSIPFDFWKKIDLGSVVEKKDLFDKIVIFGYLGPEQEDMYRTNARYFMSTSGTNMYDSYDTEVLANCIVNYIANAR